MSRVLVCDLRTVLRATLGGLYGFMDLLYALVAWTKVCRGLCRNAAPHVALLMFDVVLQVFSKIASTAASYAQVPEEDFLLRCSVTSERGTRDEYWFLLIASGRSGPHPATQTFMRLVPKQSGDGSVGVDGGGLLLAVVTEELVVDMAAPLSAPFLGAQSSSPRFFDEATVAAQLVTRDDLDIDIATKVTMSKLLFEEVEGGFRVTGADAKRRWEATLATAQPPRQRRPAPPPGDFLSLLEAPPAPRWPAAPQRPPMQSHSEGLAEPPVAACPAVVDDNPAPFDDDFMAALLDIEGGVEDAIIGDAPREEVRELLNMLEEEEMAAEAAEDGEASDASCDLDDDNDGDGEADLLAPPSAPAESAYSDEAGILPPPPPPPLDGILPPARALVAVQMHGVLLERTGATQGALANVFDLGSASSSARRRPVGTLHQLKSNNYKATCKIHKQCVLWVTLRGQTTQQTESDLVRWLSLATEVGGNISVEGHAKEARDIKVAYGMQLRK